MKRIEVEGIPNIRLTRAIKDKIEDAANRYIAQKYPFPSHGKVRAWLEKVGNEAYPKEHRELLGVCGYNHCIEQEVEGTLTRNSDGEVCFRRGSWNTAFFSFTIRVFEVWSSLYGNGSDTYVMKYINRRIKEDQEKIVLTYYQEVTEREKEATGLRDTLLSGLFWAEYSQELPEEIQKLVKTLIVENYTESCKAFEKFKEKVHG